MSSSPQQNGRPARVGLRASASTSQALGAADPRLRRNPQALTDPALLKSPLGVDSQGRIELRLAGVLNLEPNGTLTVLVGAPLATQAGSPEKLVLLIEDASLQVVRGQLAARPEARHVKSNTPGVSGTLADELRAVDTARRYADERMDTDEARARAERVSRRVDRARRYNEHAGRLVTDRRSFR